MAQNSMMDNLSIGNSKQTEFVKVTYSGTRFAFFWDIIKLRFMFLVRLNFLALLFFLPLILVLIYQIALKNGLAAILPFSANLGVGYPVTVGTLDDFKSMKFAIDLQYYAFLIPLCMLGFIGLAGVFRVAKFLSWDYKVSMLKDFFGGVKRDFLKYMVVGTIFGAFLFLLLFNWTAVNNLKMSGFLGWVSMIVTVIVFIVLFSASMFMCTQATNFNMNFGKLLKNSFVFSIGLFVPNVFFFIVAVVPFVLLILLTMIVPSLMLIAILPVMLLAFSYIALIFTLYSHFVYERFLVHKIDFSKNSNTEKKDWKEPNQVEETQFNNLSNQKPKKPARYANPKKNAKRTQPVKDDDVVIDNSED
ncbi:MAG: hypothetical protein LBU60_03220 [Clostridiales bacterium]|jgi:uncharacterized membrane protein YesL|nr:hypothetical protein [Clostridiales bacterium]